MNPIVSKQLDYRTIGLLDYWLVGIEAEAEKKFCFLF